MSLLVCWHILQAFLHATNMKLGNAAQVYSEAHCSHFSMLFEHPSPTFGICSFAPPTSTSCEALLSPEAALSVPAVSSVPGSACKIPISSPTLGTLPGCRNMGSACPSSTD